ncbi:hypothetical protein Syun_018732 [Stephania yunnanensis]|uniref:Eukaryotic translation initiation factor 4G n=1 Tax=Stephania yunnanensis TaxID=152371 RepID=A0AAP0ITF8_9MAGN
MSLNQSKSERSDSSHLRKSGRSGTSANQRTFSGGGTAAVAKGGGGAAPPPPSSSFNSTSTGSSFKKSGNGQGGQSKVSSASTNSEFNASSAARLVQNGGHLQPPLPGVSDGGAAGVVAKPINSQAPRSTRAVPKAPTSQSSSGASDSVTPTTPAKSDAAKGFSLQFGSISPGFVNGMQIPARTSSAPPNLDEQKRDQASHGFRALPTAPIPSAPKVQQSRKDVGNANHSGTGDSLANTQGKRDLLAQVPAATGANPPQKPPVLPMPGKSVAMSFQPQVPIPFGGPNAQIPSKGVAATSQQMPVPMPVGNAGQVPQQVVVTALQTHPLQPQGMMTQGQGMSFTARIGHQLPPQLGNLGIGQQQAGSFSGSRSKVRITDPKTHEELSFGKRADSYSDSGSSGSRPHALPSQSQAIPSFTPVHQINYYPALQHGSYNPASIFFPTQIPHTLTNTQMTPGSQPSRYNFQVGQVPPNVPFVNPSAVNPSPVSKFGPPVHSAAETLSVDHSHDSQVVVSSGPSGPIPVTVKPAVYSLGGKAGSSSVVVPSPAVIKGEPPKLLRSPKEVNNHHGQRDIESGPEGSIQQSKSILESSNSVPLSVTDKCSSTPSTAVSSQRPVVNIPSSATAVFPEESTVTVTSPDGRRKETVKRSESFKDQLKKPSRKDTRYSQSQVQDEHSESLGISKSSSIKVTTDITKPPENLQAPLVSGSSTSSLIAPSHGFKSSSRNGNAVEDGAPNTLTEASETLGEQAEGSIRDTLTGADASEVGADVVRIGDSLLSKASGFETERPMSGDVDMTSKVRQDERALSEIQLKQENTGAVEEGKAQPSAGIEHVSKTLEISGGPTSVLSEKEMDLDTKETIDDNEFSLAKAGMGKSDRLCSDGVDTVSDNLVIHHDSVGTSTIPPNFVSPLHPHEDVTSTMDGPAAGSESSVNQNMSVVDSGVSHHEVLPALEQVPSEVSSRLEGKSTESTSGSVGLVSISKDKSTLESTKLRSNPANGKKKKKDILKAADAAGSTSDLYMAYKGPEVKLEPSISSESIDSSSSVNVKPAPSNCAENNVLTSEEDGQIKAEPDDWEDAADISTPKLKAYGSKQGLGGVLPQDEDGSRAASKKKYSRDFLLTFMESCTDLPLYFEIKGDIAEVLMSVQVGSSHIIDSEPYPNSGRNMHQGGGPRPERRGSGMIEDDKWSKSPGSFGSGRDLRMEIGHGSNVVGFRPGQGGNHGVLRNPRGQTGGILSGPMQSLTSQGSIQRNNSDADRWQRATAFRGLIPAPLPHQQMHKAEKKYEVGKASDEEESKQRQLKGILNKLTPQNFDKLFEQVKAVNIDNADTLAGVIAQIFDKALMEPTFCEMYANFCSHLAGELPVFSEDNEKITFRRLLLTKCQEEFERGEREQAEADRVEEEGEIKCSEEEREEKKTKARRRMLGNIRLIGELYKKKMLTERIMHECIRKLLAVGHNQNPDEEDVEALCKLMSTIGEMIDHAKNKEHMDAYFNFMTDLSNDMGFSSRVRFMLKDSIDLRKNKWQQRRKVEGPKKIEEVHRDAAQERQVQASRLARGPSIGSMARRGQMDFGPRGSSMMPSPNGQMGGSRGLPAQIRGYGNQDVRLEDRHPYESRMVSVPLSQRPIDDSITLGPQGGLARGMSIRGHPLMSGAPLVDISHSLLDSRRMAAGPNGYSSASDWISYNSREEIIPRYASDRSMVMPAYEQLNSQEQHAYVGNREFRNADRSFEGPRATSPATRVPGSSNSSTLQQAPSEKVYPEERLRDLSIAAIKEFYSAKDEKEVTLCIKDLNSPSFYPSMVSLWVTDSFERKDMERDLLAKLLVNLTKSQDSLLSQVQLIKGFEFVLETLEDAMNDAPRATEFVGCILGKVVLENVVSLRDVGHLIHEGGEEQGRLLQLGLASDVLGSILEIIKLEKGESVLNEMCEDSNLRLEDFRPPNPYRSRKLEAFL